MADLTGMGAVADLAGKVVDRFWPNKTEQEKSDMVMALQIMQSQAKINEAEAANPRLLTSGWRPYIGWVCGAALTLEYVVKPLAIYAAGVAHYPLPPLPGIDANLWELLLAMLGLGGLRTVEKLKGKA